MSTRLRALVESTTGWLGACTTPKRLRGGPARSPRQRAGRTARSDAAPDSFRPILLPLHSEADEVVPIEGMSRFIEALRGHYADQGRRCGTDRVQDTADDGCASEHAGLGRWHPRQNRYRWSS